MSAPAEPTVQRMVEIGFDRLRAHLLNQAELIFLEALSREPDHAAARRLVGVARCKMGRFLEGLADLRVATNLAPELEVAWNDLAVALRETGDATAATDAHDRAAAIRARDPAAGPLPTLAALAFATDRAIHRFELGDYPYVATIRHGGGRPSHPKLTTILEGGRGGYEGLIDEMAELGDHLGAIPMGGDGTESHPYWLNAWCPPLDGMAITAMLKRHAPRLFVEVGSGVSTKFARRAIRRLGLTTRIVSIDPEPRNEVDKLCDQVIRKPLEHCDPAMFDVLQAGDIVFLDSSHRAFQGSDVTVFFLEILPRLKPGVIVQVHDIYLPDDYISGHVDRMWNEQYLLATALLFGEAFEVLFPAWWAGRDPALRARITETVCIGPLAGLDPYGASFWMRRRG
ncbi:MAG: class I SAM-dependent methyltransferase [Phenylobacterium sp.]